MAGLLTIGASTHSLDHFLALLRKHGVSAIADVRSVPASRFTPQFNRETLSPALEAAEIHYVFLGKELGARSSDPACYVDGKVQFERLAQTPAFAEGIERLIDGADREQIAVMCTEQDPLECHRTVLVSRVLVERGVEISHIRGDGSLESHTAAMTRLREEFGLDQPSLLESDDDLIARALALQEAKIAYVDKKMATSQ